MVINENISKLGNTTGYVGSWSYLLDSPQYTSVPLSEIINNKYRFEASAFSIDAKAAREKIINCKYGASKLYPNETFVSKAFHAPRFKRNYLDKSAPDVVGFLGSAEMLNIKPSPIKYLSKKQADEKSLFVERDTVLISCSGTIGKTTYVTKTLEKFAFSQHIIRLICKNYPGFVYAYLNTNQAYLQIQSLIYGAVIPEIEPEHLENVIIPNAPDPIKKEVHDLITLSFELRDESNDLIDCAEKILYTELRLPPIENLEPQFYQSSGELKNFETKLSRLNLRLDGSYHLPIVQQVENIVKLNSKKLIKLSSNHLTKSITLPTRFSRTYVDKDNGPQFLGGRDLFQLVPSTSKYLSRMIHKKQIENELKIELNDILTPSRGTIGKVSLAPYHLKDKVISDNIINIKPAGQNIAGYLFCFLNSEYGSILIKRQIYGGVVDALEPVMLSQIDIPILKNEQKQEEINDLVLKANTLRYKSYLKEKEAIDKVSQIMDL